MRECISVHVGQAGVQMGNACWELFGLEHGIQPDGLLPNDRTFTGDDGSFKTFYCETPSGKYVPRAIFVDTEPTVVDEVRTGTYRQLFHPDNLVSGMEDSGSIFSKAFDYSGVTVEEPLRKMVEQCDGLQGFVMYHSFGGGTGSGYATKLAKDNVANFPGKSRLQFCIYPSTRTATTLVEPYNAAFCAEGTSEFCDVGFICDNQSLYNICSQKLDVSRPTFTNLNRILAQCSSCLTASLRFDGSLNVDLTEFRTNLVPFPRIHFPLLSYAPVSSVEKAYHETCTTAEITHSVFSPESQMVECDLSKGQYMSCCLFYRGDVIPQDINSCIQRMKTDKSVHFTNWMPTGFKIGLNYQPPTVVPGGDLAKSQRAVCLAANTTAIGHLMEKMRLRFEILFKNRAFIHHYTGWGLEESRFTETSEYIADLSNEYFACEGEDTELDEYTGVEGGDGKVDGDADDYAMYNDFSKE